MVLTRQQQNGASALKKDLNLMVRIVVGLGGDGEGGEQGMAKRLEGFDSTKTAGGRRLFLTRWQGTNEFILLGTIRARCREINETWGFSEPIFTVVRYHDFSRRGILSGTVEREENLATAG